MAYETNRFCWHGLITNDTDKSSAFYQEVLGWKTMTMKMGDSDGHMFVANEVPLAHFMANQEPGAPSHWANYVRVEDVDASTAAAAENGGAILFPPTDIPPGRFSLVTSPSGARISFFHEADETTAQHHPGGRGGVHWVELHSTDIDADIAWLTATLGYEIGDMPMPNGKYYLLNHGGQMRGGAMAGHFPDAPSMWLTWFDVENADDAVARVEANGGKVFAPPNDMEGIGRMAVAADSTGAVFGIIQPAAQTA